MKQQCPPNTTEYIIEESVSASYKGGYFYHDLNTNSRTKKTKKWQKKTKDVKPTTSHNYIINIMTVEVVVVILLAYAM